MNIGIDISALQTGHRMRGIGYTIINFINNISDKDKRENLFIFYLYRDENNNPLALLNLENVNCDLRYIDNSSSVTKQSITKRFFNMLDTEKKIYIGDKRIKDFTKLDVFLQPDQNTPLPPKSKIKSILFLYDAIPYVMKADYLWDYKTARQNGKSRKGALRHQVLRNQYARMQKYNCRRASKLISISHKTKKDFNIYFGVSNSKIEVCHLGVNKKKSNIEKSTPVFRQKLTCWGYKKEPLDLKNKQFLLFIGGVDARRKLSELIAAFNNLKARGHEIYLVLAGDSLFSAKDIPNPEINRYMHSTSYKDDIFFLGFITDEERDWLYGNALAFVYPSVYEGFGLPVLEAMEHKCIVITFESPAIKEVASTAAIYAQPANYAGIINKVNLISENANYRSEIIKSGLEHTKKYDWRLTSNDVMKVLKNEV